MPYSTLKNTIWLVLLSFLIFEMGACVSTESGSRSGSSSRNTIDFSELSMSIAGKTAYEVVHESRPQWLRTRGEDSIRNPGEVMVYLEGTEYGSVESLKQIDAENVDSVEYLNGGEAQFRFGPGNTQGAIVVYIKSR